MMNLICGLKIEPDRHALTVGGQPNRNIKGAEILGEEVKKNEMVRLNMYLPKNLKEWYREESEALGLKMSNLFLIALIQYKEGKSVLARFPELMEAMKGIENKLTLEELRKINDLKK